MKEQNEERWKYSKKKKVTMSNKETTDPIIFQESTNTGLIQLSSPSNVFERTVRNDFCHPIL